MCRLCLHHPNDAQILLVLGSEIHPAFPLASAHQTAEMVSFAIAGMAYNIQYIDCSLISLAVFMNSKKSRDLLETCISSQVSGINLHCGYSAVDLQVFQLSLFSRSEELKLLTNAIRNSSYTATTGLTSIDRLRDSHRQNKTTKNVSCDLLDDIYSVLSYVFCPSREYALNFYEAGHYNKGDYFRPHYDYRLNYPAERLRTVLVYLEDVQEGGDLSFPLIGLKIKPIAGLVISWSNVESGDKNRLLSLHESEEVLEGSKTVLTFFLDKKK